MNIKFPINGEKMIGENKGSYSIVTNYVNWILGLHYVTFGH